MFIYFSRPAHCANGKPSIQLARREEETKENQKWHDVCDAPAHAADDTAHGLLLGGRVALRRGLAVALRLGCVDLVGVRDGHVLVEQRVAGGGRDLSLFAGEGRDLRLLLVGVAI